MKIKSNLKYFWLAASVSAFVLLAFHWFGFDSEALKNTILALNALALILSVPCSLFAVPVFAASNHYLELSPFSGDGIYLNTFLLFVLGFMQWFWIARFWSPTEPQFQNLDLVDGN